MKIITKSAEETIDLGRKLGLALKTGGLIELAGDLGSGKTTLIKGIAGGLGIKKPINSPTFTISRVYEFGDQKFYHFDFYRIGSMDITDLELTDALADPRSLVAVEWSEHVSVPLPKDRLLAEMRTSSEDSREITLTAEGQKFQKTLERI